VNGPISRLALAGLTLIGSLIVGTTYWQTWAAAGLADRQDNAIQLVAEFTIDRGEIYAADRRTVLATNRKRRVRGKTFFFRRYPTGGLAAHLVGYSTQARSRAGLERSVNDFLTAANSNLGTVVRTSLDELRGSTVEGNDLILTIQARAQRVAMNALRGKCGAAAAIDPQTGRVLVLVSSPTYDPNLIEGHFNRVTRQGGGCRPAAPLVNRAANGRYVPGSTFKVVTAAAALDSGRFTPDSTFQDPGYCIEYGRRVYNYADQGTPSGYGTVDFRSALRFSINSVFCNIGIALGPKPIVDKMQDFGFYESPPIETPSNEKRASGLYEGGALFEPRDSSEADPGRLAFGQERLQVTPLQMAMVAAGVANEGVVMRPFVVDRVLSPNGSIVARTRQSVLNRAMKRQTAAELAAMMESVVSGGTGTAAQIPGVRVAGKTGTAETGRQGAGRNQTSFIAFAPADAPRVAVAVMLENQSSTGGQTAAPIAKLIMQALLGIESNS
jgi:peptidoglycan glycosyltransferase